MSKKWKGIKNDRKHPHRKENIIKYLIQRDGINCQICHKQLNFESNSKKESVTIDHIVPRFLCGPDNKTNYQLTHSYCNNLKGKFDQIMIKKAFKKIAMIKLVA